MMPVSIRSAMVGMSLSLGLISCTATPPAPPPKPQASASPQASITPQASASPQVSIAPQASATPQASIAPPNTVPVTVYHMDDRCEKLVKQTEHFPKDKTLERAIGSVLTHANTADFTITDYRVTAKANVATILLRLPTGTKRSFKSMSSCEQMAYFGAMRETIVQRKEWGIQDVKFTDGKQEIQF